MDSSTPSFNSMFLYNLKNTLSIIAVNFFIIFLIIVVISSSLYVKYSIISNEQFDHWEFIRVRKDEYYQTHLEKFNDIMNNKDHLFKYSFKCVWNFIENHMSFSLW